LSAESKVRRQGKGQPKTRLQVLLATVNYKALQSFAKEKGVSMAKLLNDWLQEMRG
jgi:hypothetical protein